MRRISRRDTSVGRSIRPRRRDRGARGPGVATTYLRDNRGELLEQRLPTGDSYYLYDGLGSVVGLTDTSGNVEATYKYEPFGRLISSTGSIANPWRWLGGFGVYWDEQNKLYKMGTRYYDPVLGRFTQVDPIVSGSANAYDYVGQDPVNGTDATGLAGCTKVPDTDWMTYDFGEACDAHDTCYGDWGNIRAECDRLFLRKAREDCGNRSRPMKWACYAEARKR